MREKRILAVLVFGLPLLVLLTAALGAGYALARAMADDFSAGVFGRAALLGLGAASVDAALLLSVLGVRALREVE